MTGDMTCAANSTEPNPGKLFLLAAWSVEPRPFRANTPADIGMELANRAYLAAFH